MRDRLARQGEDALGKLAQDLLENPLVNGAITRAFEARERAVQAQEAAMGALNIPSAADIERLTRRLRSVSQRLEGIEDGVDRLDGRLERARARRRRRRSTSGSRAIEAQLAAPDRRGRPPRRRARRRPGAGAARAGAPRGRDRRGAGAQEARVDPQGRSRTSAASS